MRNNQKKAMKMIPSSTFGAKQVFETVSGIAVTESDLIQQKSRVAYSETDSVKPNR